MAERPPEDSTDDSAEDNTVDGAVAGDRGDAFFIPDLCAAPAVFFAVLLAELAVFLHVLALGPLAFFDWQAMAVGSLLVQWITLLCLALLCRLRLQLNRLTPFNATAACLCLVAGVTAATTLLLGNLAPTTLTAASLSDLSLRNTILAVVIAAVVLRYAYLQQRVALQQRSELQLRLDALQARIRPHFLFNTLNSIASLIAVQPERAEQAIEDVSELFRAALSGDRRESTLADELHLCELYLAIEALRLGERLTVSWAIDESLAKVRVPALLLQPLVENAIYHGIAQLPQGGTIELRTQEVDKRLQIEVENPVPRSPQTKSTQGHRIALENIRQRIEATFGDTGTFLVENRGTHFLVKLLIPIDAE
ncbi:MAG: sensor histidine kinase [Pseudomonadota bacterium]